MADRQFDIVVVGAGMVGASFAALVAGSPWGAGLRIGVLEASPFVMPDLSETFDPRVVALTEASRGLLEQVGAWPQIAARRVCPYRHMEVWEADGTGHIEFDCAEVRQPSLGHIVENALVVEALLQRLEDLPNVELLCPARVSGIARVARGEELLIELDGGETVATRLVAAADGARSKVRELCGLQLRQWDYGHQAIVTTITTEREHGYSARQRFLPEGPLAFLPLRDEQGDCHRCSIVWSQQSEKASELVALDDAEFCRALTLASDHCLGEVTAVDKRYCIPLWQRHAVDYVLPGVALMGDAAHTIHPLAGQGVNLGFQDVLALAEEVQRSLSRGLSPGELTGLKRYQRRRKPHNLGMMATMEGFKRLFESQALPLRLLRNDGLTFANNLGPLKNQLVRQAMGLG
ncbi:MAG: UbiH/UbiF/VisC/COQ6 family ubiquinone biosynthesis hydroxylase [Porticoccaceae bacterium]